MSSISKETGFGYNTVCNTVKDYKKNNKVKLPNKKKFRPTINDRISEFDKNAIRQKIHSFWSKHEIPTLKKMVKDLNDDADLPSISRTSFQRVLKELGFENTKLNMENALTEREDIVVCRQKYISDIRRYRSENRSIYFLGEMYVNTSETCGKIWMDRTLKSHREALIVLHIGSAEGFVEGGLLCFELNKNTENYHDVINDKFHNWFCGILPKLSNNSVIVLDNISYHSVKVDPIPTMAWEKDTIIQWLKSKGCIIEKPMVKHLIMDKVKEIRHLHEKFVIDEEAIKSKKIVLRLPPYHCYLNPIELAWATVKDHLKYNHTTFKLKAVKKLLIKAVKLITPGMWANFVRDTIEEEDKLFNIDFTIEEMFNEKKSKVTEDIFSDFSD